MDHTSFLDPVALNQQCDEAIQQIRRDIEEYTSAITVMSDFSDDSTIESVGYNDRQQQVADYRLIAEASIYAQESDLFDHQRLKSLIGDEVLDGDEIMRDRQARILSHQNNVENATQALNLANTATLPFFQSFFHVSYRYFSNLADADATIIRLLDEKMETYDIIEMNTRYLYTRSKALYDAIKRAIEDVENAYREGVYTPNMSASWRSDIRNEMTRVHEEVVAEIVASFFDADGKLNIEAAYAVFAQETFTDVEWAALMELFSTLSPYDVVELYSFSIHSHASGHLIQHTMQMISDEFNLQLEEAAMAYVWGGKGSDTILSVIRRAQLLAFVADDAQGFTSASYDFSEFNNLEMTQGAAIILNGGRFPISGDIQVRGHGWSDEFFSSSLRAQLERDSRALMSWMSVVSKGGEMAFSYSPIGKTLSVPRSVTGLVLTAREATLRESQATALQESYFNKMHLTFDSRLMRSIVTVEGPTNRLIHVYGAETPRSIVNLASVSHHFNLSAADLEAMVRDINHETFSQGLRSSVEGHLGNIDNVDRVEFERNLREEIRLLELDLPTRHFDEDGELMLHTLPLDILHQGLEQMGFTID